MDFNKSLELLKVKKIIKQYKTNLGYEYEVNYTISKNAIANFAMSKNDERVAKFDTKTTKIVSKNDTTKDIFKDTIQKKEKVDKSTS